MSLFGFIIEKILNNHNRPILNLNVNIFNIYQCKLFYIYCCYNDFYYYFPSYYVTNFNQKKKKKKMSFFSIITIENNICNK